MPRTKPQRAHFIPAGAVKVQHKASSAVAYLYTSKAGEPCAVAFYGRKQRPAWHLRYRGTAERDRNLAAFFAKVAEREAADRAHKDKPRGLELGDVLKASWGYDQTNIDWYQVTALIGRNQVELRELAQECTEHDLRGKTVPLPGHYLGKPFRKVARDGAVRLASYKWAHRADPIAIVGDRKIYAAANYTAYA